MQYNCTKCGTETNDSDDLHCRRIFRTEINKFLSSGELESAKVLYLSAIFNEKWKEHFLHNLGGELAILVMKDRKREEAEKLHREHLISLGVGYLGVSSISPVRKHRVTHCYNCKEELDNETDIECNVCGWIICSCGACGCGYPKPSAKPTED